MIGIVIPPDVRAKAGIPIAFQPNSSYRRTGDGEDFGQFVCIHCGWEVHQPRFNCCCWDYAMWMFS